MKRKYFSRTYTDDAKKYKVKFDYSNDDYIVCVKEFIQVKDFIAKEGHKLISNGYFMVEIIPKDENYVMRAYLDNEKEIQEYYFDVVSNKGIDDLTRVPFYDDLYLDVVISKTGLELYDRDELDEAHNKGDVDDKLYQIAIDTANNLMDEIRKGKNKYKNMDLTEFL